MQATIVSRDAMTTNGNFPANHARTGVKNRNCLLDTSRPTDVTSAFAQRSDFQPTSTGLSSNVCCQAKDASCSDKPGWQYVVDLDAFEMKHLTKGSGDVTKRSECRPNVSQTVQTQENLAAFADNLSSNERIKRDTELSDEPRTVDLTGYTAGRGRSPDLVFSFSEEHLRAYFQELQMRKQFQREAGVKTAQEARLTGGQKARSNASSGNPCLTQKTTVKNLPGKQTRSEFPHRQSLINGGHRGTYGLSDRTVVYKSDGRDNHGYCARVDNVSETHSGSVTCNRVVNSQSRRSYTAMNNSVQETRDKGVCSSSDQQREVSESMCQLPLRCSSVNNSEGEHSPGNTGLYEIPTYNPTTKPSRVTMDNSNGAVSVVPGVHNFNRQISRASTNSSTAQNVGRAMVDASQMTFKKIARQLSHPGGQRRDYDLELPRSVRKPPNHSDLALFSCICCLSPFGLVALVMTALSDLRYHDGDIDGAKKYSHLSFALAITGITTTVLAAVIALAASAAYYYSQDE